MIARITPDALWRAHRAAAGGVSTISGAPLPESIEDCPAGPQQTHYAMAVFIAAAHGDAGEVPVPSKVAPERARELRAQAEQLARLPDIAR